MYPANRGLAQHRGSPLFYSPNSRGVPLQTARRQELYMLLGLTGAAVGSGLQYRNFIWYAYFINTPQAASYEIADKIPDWIVPAGDSVGVLTRSLLHPDWFLPIAIYLCRKTARYVAIRQWTIYSVPAHGRP